MGQPACLHHPRERVVHHSAKQGKRWWVHHAFPQAHDLEVRAVSRSLAAAEKCTRPARSRVPVQIGL